MGTLKVRKALTDVLQTLKDYRYHHWEKFQSQEMEKERYSAIKHNLSSVCLKFNFIKVTRKKISTWRS